MEHCANGVRLDKWLWAARFYKTRRLAGEAVAGGHVHVNGTRSKPAHTVRPGDTCVITKGGTIFEITILALAERRGPASRAQALYQESEASCKRRLLQAKQRRLMRAANPAPAKRPDKRARRRIIRFTRDT